MFDTHLHPNRPPVMGELPSLLGAVQTSCTDLGGTVVWPRKPWGVDRDSATQTWHVNNKEVGMCQEEMWIYNTRDIRHVQNDHQEMWSFFNEQQGWDSQK